VEAKWIFVCFIAGFITRESLHCIACVGGVVWRRENKNSKQEDREPHEKADKDFFFPQGYDANHPDIDLLRLRNYTIGASLTEEELLGPGDGGFERVSELLGSLKPFVSWV
jgi:hypothetical protein